MLKEDTDSAVASRDITLSMIHRALSHLLKHFRVYRTYFCGGHGSAEDSALLLQALAAARRTLRRADHAALGWVAQTLAGGLPEES